MVVYDKEDQYKQIVPWLIESELLHAVYDCKGAGTGFIAITISGSCFTTKHSCGSERR